MRKKPFRKLNFRPILLGHYQQEKKMTNLRCGFYYFSHNIFFAFSFSYSLINFRENDFTTKTFYFSHRFSRSSLWPHHPPSWLIVYWGRESVAPCNRRPFEGGDDDSYTMEECGSGSKIYFYTSWFLTTFNLLEKTQRFSDP